MTRRGLLVAMMSASAVAVAQRAGAAHEDKFALANEDVEELLLLMDVDKSGKVSKREWMNFMEAEFDRLDKDGSGELDVQELRLSKLAMKSRTTR